MHKIRTIKSLIAVGAVLLAVSATQVFAVLPPAVQYLNIAPLPGAGMALNSEGVPDGQGAMQINIPVAYTPGKNYIDIASFAGQFEGDTTGRGRKFWQSGSGFVGMGFGVKPRVYLSAMAASSIIFKDSKSMNIQLQVLEETPEHPALAFGAQDFAQKEKERSSVADVRVGYYAVATKSYTWKQRPLYLTAGYGTARFQNSPIGGLSYSINDSYSSALEYDGYQVNGAVAWRPNGRFSRMTVTAAFNGRCGVLIGVHFTGKLDSGWAPVIATSLLRRWY